MNIITEEINEAIKQEFKKVLVGELEEVKIDCLCPSKAIEALEKLGADVSDELDTNGWQYDYWIKLKYEGKAFCLSGCGYYGYITLSPDED